MFWKLFYILISFVKKTTFMYEKSYQFIYLFLYKIIFYFL